jgi:hypothetical protein
VCRALPTTSAEFPELCRGPVTNITDSKNHHAIYTMLMMIASLKLSFFGSF